MKRYFAESELIINSDGSVFHLHVKPENLADKVILEGIREELSWLLHTLKQESVILRAESFIQ